MCSMFVLNDATESSAALFMPFGWMVAMGAEMAKSLTTTQHYAQQLVLLQVALVTYALEVRL